MARKHYYLRKARERVQARKISTIKSSLFELGLVALSMSFFIIAWVKF